MPQSGVRGHNEVMSPPIPSPAVVSVRILSRSQRRLMRAIAMVLAVLVAAGAASGSWLAHCAGSSYNLQWTAPQHTSH